MTVQEIKEKKEKKFFERSKERLFELVDHIDTIKKVGDVFTGANSTDGS